MITIDGVDFDVPVIKIKRNAEFLYKYAERNQLGKLLSELIGVYFNYQIQFGRTTNTTEYAALWEKLTEPTEFHEVVVPDGDASPLTFQAYFAGVGDELRKDTDSKTFWKELTVNFIAQEPARVPS
jgi:hypothetical protein